jgi:uncharacterized protein HemY
MGPTKHQIKTTVLYHLDHGLLEQAEKTIKWAMEQTKRPGTALLAAKLALEHQREAYKADHAQDVPEIKITISNQTGREITI